MSNSRSSSRKSRSHSSDTRCRQSRSWPQSVTVTASLCPSGAHLDEASELGVGFLAAVAQSSRSQCHSVTVGLTLTKLWNSDL
eukprot:5411963-Pyramimonas_sp.AAC.1